ncbi:hypothetical protein ACQ4PT_056344 [Festuca glaucescens]
MDDFKVDNDVHRKDRSTMLVVEQNVFEELTNREENSCDDSEITNHSLKSYTSLNPGVDKPESECNTISFHDQFSAHLSLCIPSDVDMNMQLVSSSADCVKEVAPVVPLESAKEVSAGEGVMQWKLEMNDFISMFSECGDSSCDSSVSEQSSVISSPCTPFTVHSDKTQSEDLDRADIWVPSLDLDEEDSALIIENEQFLDILSSDFPSPSFSAVRSFQFGHFFSSPATLHMEEANDADEAIFWPFERTSYSTPEFDKFMNISPRISTMHIGLSEIQRKERFSSVLACWAPPTKRLLLFSPLLSPRRGNKQGRALPSPPLLAGLGQQLLTMAGTLVLPVALGTTFAGRTKKSHGSRRPTSMLAMLLNRPVRMAAFTGLRSVHSFTTTPSSSFRSTAASYRSSRRGRRSRFVTRAMFERFTEKAIKVIMLAQEEARRLGHNFVGTEQVLLGLVGEGTGIAAKVLKSMGINLKDARVEVEKIIGRGNGFVAVEIPFTPRAKRVLELSLEEARQLGHNYIGSEHLLLGLLREGEGVAARVLESLGADPSNIRTQVVRMIGETTEAVGAGVGGGSSGNKMPTLEEYGTNLTKLAEEGKLDPVVGREPQIERVIQILGRRTKNNPCLIGEPGVGKTAIAEGLAQRINSGDVPETIEGKKVITLDMGLLVAGTKYRGEFEERLKKLMEEIKQSDEIILFIDEVHTLIGAGAAEGAIDAANILKPALARGELQCIGATTLDEYRKHVEKDPALERRFQPVKVPEPSVDETIEILRGLRERYEIHHKLSYTDDSLIAAAKLSYQYISDRFLPDKAIDLIDEAGSRVRLRHAQVPEEARELDKELKQITKDKNEAVRGQDFEKAGELRDREMELKAQITALIDKSKEMIKADTASGETGPMVHESDIQHIVSSWTGIPVEKVSTDESDKLLKMEETLHKRVIGQDEAVKAISRSVRRARVGLKNPNRPIASFIFAGPTGVGKSELAKTLASYYFGSEEAMIRLDMSEFMERHTVSKLIGSPPGYVGYTEGGQLTEAVRRRPYSVVLFDEIEKAHPDVFNMMLQILEDGRLTDSKGRTVDFKNTLLIMTSNVGSSVIEKGGRKIGFDLESDEKDSSYGRIKSLVVEEMKQYFRPEFLNRLDEMIVFRQLTKLEVKEIADIMLQEVFTRLKLKEINLQVTEKFKERVVDEGYNPSYGARPLRRAIMRLLEDSLAEKMLAGEVKEGDSAIVDVDSEGKVVVLNGQSGLPELQTPAVTV